MAQDSLAPSARVRVTPGTSDREPTTADAQEAQIIVILPPFFLSFWSMLPRGGSQGRRDASLSHAQPNMLAGPPISTRLCQSHVGLCRGHVMSRVPSTSASAKKVFVSAMMERNDTNSIHVCLFVDFVPSAGQSAVEMRISSFASARKHHGGHNIQNHESNTYSAT